MTLPDTTGAPLRMKRSIKPVITGGDTSVGARVEDRIGADQVKAARQAARLTQVKAAALIGTSIDNWRNYEQGRARMAPAAFELFLLKAGLFTLREWVPGSDVDPGRLRLRLRDGRVVEIAVRHEVASGLAEALEGGD